MRKVIIIVTLILSNALLAQSPQAESGMRASFSMPALLAYQESSFAKINDFWQYVTIIADEKTPETLEGQVQQTAVSMFEQGSKVATSANQLSLLEDFIQQSAHFNLVFSARDLKAVHIFSDYWTVSYTLDIKKGDGVESVQMLQKVYFRPVMKQFGAAGKEVWVILLGDITAEPK